MSINLMDLVKDQLTDGIMDNLSTAIGANKSTTSSAIGKFLPALIGGIADKGSTESGASSLLKLITDNGLGANTLSNLGSLLGGGDKTSSFLKLGGSLLTSILGGRQDSMLGKLLSMTGLGRGIGSKLLSFLAPIVLGQIGKLISGNKMDAKGLSSMLSDQKAHLAGGAMASANDDDNRGGGMGWLKWLLPLLLLGALLWYFTKGGSDSTTTNDADAIESNEAGERAVGSTHSGHDHDSHAGHDHTGHDHASHDHAGHDHSGHSDGSSVASEAEGAASGVVNEAKDAMNKAGEEITFSVDKAGNLVSSTGEVIAKKGEFSVVNGKYMDKDGKEINLLAKIGGAIGGAAKATAGAVGAAAGKTADAFKGMFGGLFSKKEKVGSTYTLTDIEFNKENHRISNFSKAEVEGLAAALKAYPDAKIQVQVHSKDDGNSTEDRAKVVRDMLVTLGVDKGQISAKGMGDKDAAKAMANKVEIMVEQTK